ncbi:MAG: hypothetical protein HDT34_02135 [Clostridiales bacterium]|nr:hypothetical protein [Clostridiales bacterium]
MTNEQRKALTDLQEKIIQNRLSKSDTSWVETEEEMNDLKQAIIKESMSIRENNDIIYITDYINEKDIMIFDDGFISEKNTDYSSVEKSNKTHKISGIMILGWLVLLFALSGFCSWIDRNIGTTLSAYAVWGVYYPWYNQFICL